MAGNSKRKGAMRKGASKKGATVGSGGQRAQGLKGRGPTPKATERDKHPAARRARAAAKRSSSSKGSSSTKGGGSRGRRREGGAEYVVGRNAVSEALAGGVPADALYVAERIDSDERVKASVRLAADLGIAVLEAPRVELDRIADGLPHQGMALQIPEYEYAHANDLLEGVDAGSLIVALDHITDPRNLGAVIRSAAAFGARGVLIPERRSASMTAAAWKASAGAAARIPVAKTPNLSRQIAAYAKAGMFVVGLDADGDQMVDEVVADVPLVVVIGAEGSGLSRLVRDGCDVVASIPMSSGMESLNASVAAGIALFCLDRSRSS